MRLIDAGALEKEIDTIHFSDREDWCFVLEAIECAPTVDAVPVAHGHWWRDEGADLNELTCSVCNKTYRMRMDLRANVYPHNYCPNCGARMDEE